MPAKPKYTREALLAAALDIIREQSIESITAQELGRRLGASAPSVFTHFATVDDIRHAAVDAARELFDRYAELGLAMQPPFKGFGMQCLRFAAEEPKLYELLFMRSGTENPLMHYVRAEGRLDGVIARLEADFSVSREAAHWLFSSLVIYTHGLCCMIACGVVHYTNEELAHLLGAMFQRLTLGARVSPDAQADTIPQDADTPAMTASLFLL